MDIREKIEMCDEFTNCQEILTIPKGRYKIRLNLSRKSADADMSGRATRG